MMFDKKSAARFWGYVIKSDGCWMWSRSKDKDGYGKFKDKKTAYRAHRVAFFLAHARWPSPMCLHHCDTPACCNPSHLFEGTNEDNVADCVAKGREPSGDRHGSHTHPERWARGDRNKSSKLTPVEVTVIRGMGSAGVSRSSIARSVGISRYAVRSILDGRTWRHIPPPEEKQ